MLRIDDDAMGRVDITLKLLVLFAVNPHCAGLP